MHKDVDADLYRAKAKHGETPEEKRANREKFLSKVKEVRKPQCNFKSKFYWDISLDMSINNFDQVIIRKWNFLPQLGIRKCNMKH
jgi:hypothetical protein